MILPDFQSLVHSLSDQNQSRAFFSESGNARRDGDLCGWKEIPDFCAGGEVNSMFGLGMTELDVKRIIRLSHLFINSSIRTCPPLAGYPIEMCAS